MTTARKFCGFSLILAALPCLLSAQTTVILSTSPNPSVLGVPVVLSVAVTPSNATGHVTFYDGVAVLGTKSLASGATSFSTILLSAGIHQLKAYYGGDSANAAATSNGVVTGSFRPSTPNRAPVSLSGPRSILPPLLCSR
jgi:hypothetical protein